MESEQATASVPQFWQDIEKARTHQDPTERLTELLRGRTPAELAAFDESFRATLGRAYNWNLWGAAHIALDGCSEDGFEYFRTWLIMQGQHFFERVLRELGEGWDFDDVDQMSVRYPRLTTLFE